MLKEFLNEDNITSIKYVKIEDNFYIGKGYEGYSLFVLISYINYIF